ncbi:RHE_PE00001 family protein [Methylocystis heyeri]|nr:RHE_PE00001 family protein [Methylocystis heyeri]
MTDFQLPDPFPWTLLVGPLATAEDAVARLDERLARSPIRDGWIERTHFSDAADSLWLAGELVHTEDLVLHDAHMDVRAPTHEVTRAHAILRARRRVAETEPGLALSPIGLETLRGRSRGVRTIGQGRESLLRRGNDEEEDLGVADWDATENQDALAEELASIDTALASSERLLAGAGGSPLKRDSLVYDADWDEDERLAEWSAAVETTADFPPVLAAAIVLDAWESIEPLQHAAWLGQIFTAALLRDRRKTRAHLLCLNSGLRAIPREKRRASNRERRLVSLIEAIAAAAEGGLRDHDRWALARRQLERKLIARRSTSKLPRLIEFVMSRPAVSAGMIANELSVTPRAAQDLVVDLGLREITGRGRYRAWAVL